MDHIYFHAAALQRKQKIGDGDCVTLIKEFTSAGPTMRWRAGAEVLNNPAIRPGTAIATFVKGLIPITQPAITQHFFCGMALTDSGS